MLEKEQLPLLYKVYMYDELRIKLTWQGSEGDTAPGIGLNDILEASHVTFKRCTLIAKLWHRSVVAFEEHPRFVYWLVIIISLAPVAEGKNCD